MRKLWPTIVIVLPLALGACSGLSTPAAMMELFQGLSGGQGQTLEKKVKDTVDDAREIVEGADELRGLFGKE